MGYDINASAFIRSRSSASASYLDSRSYDLTGKRQRGPIAMRPVSHAYSCINLTVEFTCGANPMRLWIQLVNKGLCNMGVTSNEIDSPQDPTDLRHFLAYLDHMTFRKLGETSLY